MKLKQPTKRKAQWLDDRASRFSQAVQFGLDIAQEKRTASRAKLHKAMYYGVRERFGLPSDYARMAVNATVALSRSFYGLRKSKYQRRTSFPKVNGSQGLGLGTNAYTIVERNGSFILRASTGHRGDYMWLPLCVPAKFQEKMRCVKGDAKLFKRDDKWFAMLPVKGMPASPVRDGESTFIGVDLGIVRIATVATPDRVFFFDGREARREREHFADIRRRYQRHNRLDRVKARQGKETRWMTDLNHKISKRIVEIADQYDNPVIVFESLDGIRSRVRGSKRFNRMMSSWAFRQLLNFATYKAERAGIEVVFIDPRGTSKTCSKCGHSSRSNRPTQSQFLCVACGYQQNADANAAYNIAAVGARLLQQGPPDTAQPSSESQTGDIGLRPDVAKDDTVPSCRQTTTSTGSCGTSPL